MQVSNCKIYILSGKKKISFPVSRIRVLQRNISPNLGTGARAADESPDKISRARRHRRQRRRLQRHHVRVHRAAVDGAQAEQEQVGGHHPRMERRRHSIQQV